MSRSWCWSICVAVVCCVNAPASAGAQGFLQSMFGWGAPPAQIRQVPSHSETARPHSPFALPSFSQSNHRYREPLFDPYRQHDRSEERLRDYGGRYRTVCVRLCDGYYWPISQATGSGGLYRDANVCRASCGTEARLFYGVNSESDAATMMDLQGRPYMAIPNAFRYRKKLVEGCRCQPEPWAASELNRHRTYELAAANAVRKEETITSSGASISSAVPNTARWAAMLERDVRPDEEQPRSVQDTPSPITIDPPITTGTMPRTICKNTSWV